MAHAPGSFDVAAFRSGRQGSLPAIASVLGLAALLLHSWVDYPLRTGSLATVAGLLAGIVVARAARPLEKSGTGVILPD